MVKPEGRKGLRSYHCLGFRLGLFSELLVKPITADILSIVISMIICILTITAIHYYCLSFFKAYVIVLEKYLLLD